MQKSNEHVYSWYAVIKVAIEAKVEQLKLFTATKMRHQVSTMYTGLDIPDQERIHFYKHMCHSAATIYQAALAEIEITQVRIVLTLFDNKGTTNSNVVHSTLKMKQGRSNKVMET
jgi:hypothetical protein